MLVHTKKQQNIAKTMFLYWILVIMWQTLRPVANRSLLDSLVKMALFAGVAVYGFNHRTKSTDNTVPLLVLFELTQIVTLIIDTVITASTVITCVFMFAEILVFLVWLGNESISKESVYYFAKGVLIVTIVMSLYNVVFNTNRFLRVFSGSGGAYGSECSSFLYSNHEFALYLGTGLVFAVWLSFEKQINKLFFILIVLLLSSNMLSTYSRTAIFGTLGAVTAICFFANKKYFKYLVFVYILIAIVVITVPLAREIFFDKILKGSVEKSGSIVDDGRASMYEEEWEFFLKGDIIKKLFGHGYYGREISGHDAYLFVLNAGGIIMFIFFLVVIIWSIVNSVKIIKKQRVLGALSFGLQTMAMLYMVAQTPILFFSSMDSFFITAIAVLLPKYMCKYCTDKSVEKKL